MYVTYTAINISQHITYSAINIMEGLDNVILYGQGLIVQTKIKLFHLYSQSPFLLFCLFSSVSFCVLYTIHCFLFFFQVIKLWRSAAMEVVNNIKYLAVQITNNMTWSLNTLPLAKVLLVRAVAPI